MKLNTEYLNDKKVNLSLTEAQAAYLAFILNSENLVLCTGQVSHDLVYKTAIKDQAEEDKFKEYCSIWNAELPKKLSGEPYDKEALQEAGEYISAREDATTELTTPAADALDDFIKELAGELRQYTPEGTCPTFKDWRVEEEEEQDVLDLIGLEGVELN